MEYQGEQIEIPAKKLTLGLIFLGCAVFLAVSSWYLSAFEFGAWFYDIKLILLVFFGVIMTSIALLVLPFKLLDFRKAMTINRDGMIDNSRIGKTRFIAWNQIAGFELIKMKGNTMLLVHITNPLEYLRAQNPKTHPVLKNFYNTYGTPIVILTSTIRSKPVELLKLLNDALLFHQENPELSKK